MAVMFSELTPASGSLKPKEALISSFLIVLSLSRGAVQSYQPNEKKINVENSEPSVHHEQRGPRKAQPGCPLGRCK